MTQTVENYAPDQHHGVHLPSPTYWPLVFGVGFLIVAFGIIFGPDVQDALRIEGSRWLVPALGLAVIAAAVGGWLISNLRERLVPSEAPVEVAKFAMWCFLGTEVIIFGALIGRVLGIWFVEREATRILTEPLTSLLLVSVNTFLLLVSSLAVVLALASIQQGNRRGLVGWLAVTALLGAAFVGVQGYEYSKLVSEGLTPGSSQFGSAFYFLTGNHGLHVIIGVIWSVVLIVRAALGGFTAQQHMGIEVFGLYWHFVDVVWIMIFTLVYLI